MSIWASMAHPGEHDDGSLDGSVLSYIEGWSNHYPTAPMDRDDGIDGEQPACVTTAWLPPYCVPGHDEEPPDEADCMGPWLRLSIYSREVSVWTSPAAIGAFDSRTVVLNEDAVRALHADLTAWLDREKVYPG